jgi:biotin transport system substrate-specific component
VSLAAMFAALTAVASLVAIPVFGPVPFTFQVLIVLLSGLVLGPRLGATSMLAYLALGLVAPVYAGGASGLGVLVGPAGGYLWGFVLSALVTGALARRLHSPGVVRLTVVALAGLVPIYVLGASWLAFQLHSASWHVVVWGGILEFVPLDALKVLTAATFVRSLASSPLGRASFQRSR